MGKIGDLFVRLGLKSDEFNKGIADSQKKTKTFGAQAGEAIGGLSARFLSITALVVGFTKVISDGVRTIANYERKISELSSVLGKSKGDMEALTSAGRELAKTTEFTASDVAQLQINLARLGFGEGDIMNMEDAIVKFATAVGTDAASAADFTGASLRAFGLQTKDTTDLLNVMAAATTASALDFPKLSTAIGIVAPVAKTFGLTARDTAALVGQLANAGIDASTSATALRNILLKLAQPGSKIHDLVKTQVKDLPSLLAALKELRESGVGLTEIAENVDARATAAFATFLDGVDSVEELRGKLDDTNGVLDEMYKTNTDNLIGSVRNLDSAWEELTLTFQGSTGPMKSVVDWLNKIVNKVSDLIRTSQTGEQGDKEKQAQKELLTRFTTTGDMFGRDEMLRQYSQWVKDADAAYDRAIDAYNAHKTLKNKKAMYEAGNYSINLADIRGAVESYGASPVVTPDKTVDTPDVTPDLTDTEKKKQEEELKELDGLMTGLLDKNGKLTKKYKEDLALFEKYGKDTTALTAKFQLDVGMSDIDEENEGLQGIREDAERTDEACSSAYAAWRKLQGLPPIDKIIDPQAIELIQMAEEQFASLGVEMENTSRYAVDLNDLLSSALNDAVQGFSDALQDMFDSLYGLEEMDSGAIMAALLKPLADTAKQAGEILMATGIGMLLFSKALKDPANAPLLIAAGAGLIAIGAAAGARLSALADSGSSSGSTSTTSYSATGSGTSSAELTINVKGTIKGSDILISGSKTSREWGK